MSVRVLSTMTALAMAAGEPRLAEGFLLELTAVCAFGERAAFTPGGVS